MTILKAWVVGILYLATAPLWVPVWIGWVLLGCPK